MSVLLLDAHTGHEPGAALSSETGRAGGLKIGT